jgi:hypothetical protein
LHRATIVTSRFRQSTFPNDVALFIALLSTAFALGAALAHALELPNKIAMSREEYFIAQQIYRGWDRLAYVLGVQLTAMIAVSMRFWHSPRVLRPSLVAIGGLLAAQLVFWTWTFPTNIATDNWTSAPANWEALRTQWEFSHLAGAACQLVAMIALVVAALARRRTIDG